jgi:hypothetical protein
MYALEVGVVKTSSNTRGSVFAGRTDLQRNKRDLGMTGDVTE